MDNNEEIKKEKKKRHILSVDLDDELEKLLNERIEYLQEKNPYARITRADAIRHALYNTTYKKRPPNESNKKR